MSEQNLFQIRTIFEGDGRVLQTRQIKNKRAQGGKYVVVLTYRPCGRTCISGSEVGSICGAWGEV